MSLCPVSNIACTASELLVVMFLLRLEHDGGAGVEPLAILQHVCLGAHISGDHIVITIMPVYLKQSTFYNIVNQDKNVELTSAAGLPPALTHSKLISISSVTSIAFP